ncbi:hypothetical protein CANARDRAFT_28805 [[Candida] arabinofermentans NRRL YB-2248]|uniref:Ras modification protein ERF4 n=1 Tax=[Candida] arabinofermentans NRRL YB-2248 TaxID=983967 RepID=A0A1E4SZZ9_9ASCO|nr:hypothetical protein CANARDRAFT_28805 [[Candida] arabinofermentans NRRL YB-2248]
MSDADAQPKFFNYHEYRQSYQYNLTPYITTHFPNVYEPSNADTTRIVRVPRVAEVDHPRFSTAIPGTEPGAILPSEQQESLFFKPVKEIDGQWYSESSISPLTLYLDQETFEKIVTKVNEYLESQYKASLFWIIYMIFDLLTFGLFRFLRFGKRSGDELEDYVEKLNKDFLNEDKPIRLVSPRLSGYLSLDFIIPTPKGPSGL